MTGQKFFFYCAFLAVAVSSVMFGLDWMSAPMAPMPETKNLVFVAPPPPAPPAPVVASAPPIQTPNQSPIGPSNQSQPAIQAATSPTAPVPPQSAEPDFLPPLASVVAPTRPKCDIAACAAAYRSFRESDCTYNPSYGPRRLCTKGVPTEVSATPDAPPATNADGAATSDAKCNVDACAAAYRTFDATDCTYRSGNGSRKLCVK